MSFTRRIENFSCASCGKEVVGNGYTNHCPYCLSSKHVDISPGDRASNCGGMMEPIRLEGSSPNYTIIHQCVVCKEERRVRTGEHDSLEALLALAGRSKR
jgi:hypothetical protein